MDVTVVCPGCSKTYQLPETHIGKRARCKKCKTEFVAQAPLNPPPPPVEVTCATLEQVVVHGPLPELAKPKAAFNVECPSCRHFYDLDRALAGKRARCKGCGEVFRVPSPAESMWAMPVHEPPPTLPMDVLIDDDVDDFPFAPVEVRPSVARRKSSDSSTGTWPGGSEKEKEPASRPAYLPYLIGVAVGLPTFWLTWWLVQSWFNSSEKRPQVVAEARVTDKALVIPSVNNARQKVVLEHKQSLGQLIATHEQIVAELTGIQNRPGQDSGLAQLKTIETKRDELSRHHASLAPLHPDEEAEVLKEFAPRLSELLEQEREELKRIHSFVDNRQAVAAEIRHINQAIAELHLAYRGGRPST